MKDLPEIVRDNAEAARARIVECPPHDEDQPPVQIVHPPRPQIFPKTDPEKK